MKISGKRGYLISMESVTMTDIVMNMFIFFFISFSILYTFNPQHTKRLDVKLPSAQNAIGSEDKKQAEITIAAEGPVYLDGDLVSSAELKEKITQMHRQEPGFSVILRADKRVSFRNVVAVLDILSGIGITRVSIAAAAEQ